MRKDCKHCGIEKPLTDFGIQSKKKDGTKNICKDCVSELNHERYLKNREKHRAEVAEWKQKNPDKVRKHKREYVRRKRAKEEKR